MFINCLLISIIGALLIIYIMSNDLEIKEGFDYVNSKHSKRINMYSTSVNFNETPLLQ